MEITFEYAGEGVFSQGLTINIPGISNRNFYTGGIHYSNGFYYGTISGKLARQPFAAAGQANDFQVRVKVIGATDFNINEIGLRFSAAS